MARILEESELAEKGFQIEGMACRRKEKFTSPNVDKRLSAANAKHCLCMELQGDQPLDTYGTE